MEALTPVAAPDAATRSEWVCGHMLWPGDAHRCPMSTRLIHVLTHQSAVLFRLIVPSETVTQCRANARGGDPASGLFPRCWRERPRKGRSASAIVMVLIRSPDPVAMSESSRRNAGASGGREPLQHEKRSA